MQEAEVSIDSIGLQPMLIILQCATIPLLFHYIVRLCVVLN